MASTPRLPRPNTASGTAHLLVFSIPSKHLALHCYLYLTAFCALKLQKQALGELTEELRKDYWEAANRADGAASADAPSPVQLTFRCCRLRWRTRWPCF